MGAVVVFALLALVCVKSWRLGARGPLFRPALAVALLGVWQVLLGGTVIWSQKAVLVTTGHLVVGALLLGATGLLTLRALAAGGAASVSGRSRWGVGR